MPAGRRIGRQSGPDPRLRRGDEPRKGRDSPRTAPISRLAAIQGTTGGECARETRVNGRWLRAGVDAGAIVCFTDGSSGDAVLAWSYVDDAIMVRAINEHGDSKALYDFFLKTSSYIAP